MKSWTSPFPYPSTATLPTRLRPTSIWHSFVRPARFLNVHSLTSELYRRRYYANNASPVAHVPKLDPQPEYQHCEN